MLLALQLYQSMLGQALNHKTTIESWRASNVYGTTIWMFNELWPTGGWGSIEYGGNTTGQVSGGRWKPLQVRRNDFLRRFILKSEHFPRQARDKHRENSPKRSLLAVLLSTHNLRGPNVHLQCAGSLLHQERRTDTNGADGHRDADQCAHWG